MFALGLGLTDVPVMKASVGGGPTLDPALPVTTISYTSSGNPDRDPLAFPIQFYLNRPPEVLPTDYINLIVRQSTDNAIVLNVSVLSDPGPLTFPGLSAITTGTHSLATKVERGATFGPSSSLLFHGPAVDGPAITGTTTSSQERLVISVPVTASQSSTFVLGGADAALLEKVGSEPATSISVRLLANAVTNFESKASYSFTVTPTSEFGVAGTAASFTHNVTNLVEQPSLVNFANATAVPVSTVSTSNTQTVSGLPSGDNAAFTVTNGTLVKDGVDVGESGTITNGDVIALRLTSSASSATTIIATLVAGPTGDQVTVTYSVATAVASGLPQAASLALWVENDPTTMFETITGTTAVTTDGQVVGTWQDKSASAGHLVAAFNNATRPIFKDVGGVKWVEGDGTDDILRTLRDLGLWNAAGYTVAIAYRVNTAVINKYIWSSRTGSGSSALAYQSDTVTPADASMWYRETTGATNVVNPATNLTPANATAAGVDKVAIIVDDGSGITLYIDGVAGTRLAYTRGANVLNLANFSLFAGLSGSPNGFAATRIHGCAVWTAINLDATDRATATTYMGELQGRTI